MDGLDDTVDRDLHSRADFETETTDVTHVEDMYSIPGKNGRNRKDAMDSAERIMRTSGWTSALMDHQMLAL